MPKERLHILLAEETFRLVAQLGLCDSTAGQDCLMAAILPDIFFYDIPTFNLGGYGRRLHRFEGTAAVDFFLNWLRRDGDHLDKAHKYRMFGFASHFLADGFLHPLINRNCHLFSNNLDLTFKSCHHWLESELESYWLAVIGPTDGYLRLLTTIEKQTGKMAEILSFLRLFLTRAGLAPLPSEAAVRNCLLWQVRLLRLFAQPQWVKIRPWLIRFRMTQSFGVLLAPHRTLVRIPCGDQGEEHRNPSNNGQPLHSLGRLCAGSVAKHYAHGALLPPEIEGMFKPDFMARTISHLSSHLLELAKLF